MITVASRILITCSGILRGKGTGIVGVVGAGVINYFQRTYDAKQRKIDRAEMQEVVNVKMEGLRIYEEALRVEKLKEERLQQERVRASVMAELGAGRWPWGQRRP